MQCTLLRYLKFNATIQHYQLCCDVQLHRSVSRNYAGVNQAWLVCYNRDAFV